MATDSTELTFVRCPSCRSLVPAVSTRCRMCGASLEPEEAAASEPQTSSDEGSGRVRQRTMSKPKSELTSMVNKIREEAPQAEDELEAQEESAVGSESQGFAPDNAAAQDEEAPDPLGDYIEELPDDEFEGEESSSSKEVPLQAANGSDRVAFEDEDDEDDEYTLDAPEQALSIKNEARAKAERRPARDEEPTGVVRMEPGGRSRNQGRGLSFGKRDGGEERKKTEQVPPPRQREPLQERPERTASRRTEERSRRDERREARPEERKQIPRREERPARPQQESQDREVSLQGTSKPQSIHFREPRLGRLFGWLVSYADSDGSAVELREGKFFVTSSSLKKSDLVIEDPSISTPHAMVTLSLDGGLQIQDLMSERGVFVRQRGEDTYHREEETVTVEHGDWIRFGDLEFLVTLIAHVGK